VSRKRLRRGVRDELLEAAVGQGGKIGTLNVADNEIGGDKAVLLSVSISISVGVCTFAKWVETTATHLPPESMRGVACMARTPIAFARL
jgi:hypothetical protein